MGDYLIAVAIGVLVGLGLTIFSDPTTAPQVVNSPFEVLDFDDTILAPMDLVPNYTTAYDDPIKHAIEQVLIALLLAISVFLAIGILKLQLDKVYHMPQPINKTK